MRAAVGMAVIFVIMSAIAIAEDGAIAYPDGYRNWFHHHTTVNQPGHTPEGNVGIQHVYANTLAVEGLKSGTYRDGAVFVVDRFQQVEGDNSTINQGMRKVVAVMIRNAARYPETGGWGFEAFKGGDQNARVVKDGGKACFTCHAPLGDNSYLFTRGAK